MLFVPGVVSAKLKGSTSAATSFAWEGAMGRRMKYLNLYWPVGSRPAGRTVCDQVSGAGPQFDVKPSGFPG